MIIKSWYDVIRVNSVVNYSERHRATLYLERCSPLYFFTTQTTITTILWLFLLYNNSFLSFQAPQFFLFFSKIHGISCKSIINFNCGAKCKYIRLSNTPHSFYTPYWLFLLPSCNQHHRAIYRIDNTVPHSMKNTHCSTSGNTGIGMLSFLELASSCILLLVPCCFLQQHKGHWTDFQHLKPQNVEYDLWCAAPKNLGEYHLHPQIGHTHWAVLLNICCTSHSLVCYNNNNNYYC